MSSIDESKRPKVGVGLIIIKNQTEVLLGKRIGAHGEGEYAGVGGHMENGEATAETAMRELREEIGDAVRIKDLRVICTSNVRKYHPKHYVDFGMVAEWVSGEPEIMEPDKIISWDWYPLGNLPEPLFEFVRIYIKALNTGQQFFEI